jgi:hypothetical protein
MTKLEWSGCIRVLSSGAFRSSLVSYESTYSAVTVEAFLKLFRLRMQSTYISQGLVVICSGAVQQ